MELIKGEQNGAMVRFLVKVSENWPHQPSLFIGEREVHLTVLRGHAGKLGNNIQFVQQEPPTSIKII